MRCHESSCSRRRRDIRRGRSARRPSGSASISCSPPIAVTCSRIRGGRRRCRFVSTTKTRRSRRLSRPRATRPIDGVLAVGDRPTVIAARVGGGAGAAVASAGGRRGRAQQARDARAAARRRPAGALVPSRARSRLSDPRARLRRIAFPVRRQAARAVRQPRRDARRRRAELRRGASTGCARCCSRPTSAPSATRRTSCVLRRGVHSRAASSRSKA